MTKKRLTKRKINKLIKEYQNEFKEFWEWKTEQAIAYELAKDFIYQARLDYEQYINQNVNKYWIEVVKQIDKMRADAVGETYEYTKYDF